MKLITLSLLVLPVKWKTHMSQAEYVQEAEGEER